MKSTQYKTKKRVTRHNRIRAKVRGTAARPRLAVYRSNKFVYAQLINDEAGTTLAASDTRKQSGATLTLRAKAAGADIAAKAKTAGITEVVFDRGGFRYQGTVAALATGAREGGLGF
jgi:large subunit ribosomal protein L18